MKTSRCLAVLVISFMVLALVPHTAFAAEEVTVTDGQSIQDAIGEVADGGTVSVGPGTFAGGLTIDKPLTLVSTDGADMTVLENAAITITADDVTIDGFTIEGVDDSVKEHSVTASGCKNLTIKNCVFDAGREDYFTNSINAVQFSSPRADTVLIDNCVFQNGYYVTVNGYADNLTVKDSTIVNCKSGINVQIGDNLAVVDTDISVIAQGEENDTYCVRFANESTESSGMSITGGELSVDKNGLEAESGTYYSAIVVRSEATGALTVSGAKIDGEVVNLSGTVLDVDGNWWSQTPFDQTDGPVLFSHWLLDEEGASKAAVYSVENADDDIAIGEDVNVIFSELTEGTLVFTRPDLGLSLPGSNLPGDAVIVIGLADVVADMALPLEGAPDAPASAPEGFKLIGQIYRFMLIDNATEEFVTEFDTPFTLTFFYDPDAVEDPDNLTISWYDGEEWVEIECIVDTETHSVTAEIDHFSDFVLMEEEIEEEEEEPTLPETGTGIMWLIPFGLGLMLASLLVLRKRVTA